MQSRRFEECAAPVDLEFEVTRTLADSHGELGRDAPAEVLEAVGGRVVGREDCRAESLDVPVLWDDTRLQALQYPYLIHQVGL